MAEGETARFALQIAAIFLGGGAVQLIIALLRRRGEVRGLDATADATLLGSANTIIDQLQEQLAAGALRAAAVEAELRAELAAVKAEFSAFRVRHSADRDRAEEAMATERANLARMATELSRVRSDLVVAHAQIDELGRRI